MRFLTTTLDMTSGVAAAARPAVLDAVVTDSA
jgi:hypothetical protein